MGLVKRGLRALLFELEAFADRNVYNRRLYEMATNLRPERTGLPFPIWVSQGIGVRHGPRVKAFPNGLKDQKTVIIVTVEDDPKVVRVPRKGHVAAADLEALRAWVRLNLSVLQRYWEDPEMWTDDMMAALRRVER
jgi:hypothetical protein